MYTIGYTLNPAGLWPARDGHRRGGRRRRLAGIAGRVSDTLDSLGEKAKLIAARLEGLTSLDFVGSGTSLASTAEAALIFREATQTCTATYATYQYLHGPMEPLTSQQGCVLFGDRREVSLAGFLVSKGIPAVLVTSAEVAEAEGLFLLRIPDVAPISRAILEILAAQLVVGELARLRGLGIKGFRYHQDDTKIDKL